MLRVTMPLLLLSVTLGAFLLSPASATALYPPTPTDDHRKLLQAPQDSPWDLAADEEKISVVQDPHFQILSIQREHREELRALRDYCFARERDCGDTIREMQLANQRIRDDASSALYCRQNLEDVRRELQEAWSELGATRRELEMTNYRQPTTTEERVCRQELGDSRREGHMCRQELGYRRREEQACREELENRRREQMCPEVNGTEQLLQTQLQEKERQMGALQQRVQQLEADVRMKNAELQQLRDEVQQLEESDGYQNQVMASVDPERTQEVPRDCTEAMADGGRINDTYTIYPQSDGGLGKEVACYWREGRAWTTFLLRGNQATPLITFDRTWEEYKDGFGNPRDGEYWLGNENLHQLTRGGNYTLRVEVKTLEGDASSGEWEGFSVDSEANRYMLSLGTSSSPDNQLSYALQFADGTSFSARDRDYDTHPRRNCAARHQGGWWYQGCGLPYPTSPHGTLHGLNKVLSWYNLGRTNWVTLSHLAMMVAPES